MSPRIILIALLLLAGADAPTSKPGAINDATWQRMLETDRKGGEIQDLVADFEQQKFTAMLKKPLVSRGRVFVRGSTMLWDTREPEPNVLQIDPREVRIYYPAQKTIEVYKIEEKLGQLAASPLPRLSVLQQQFDFAPLALSEVGETDNAKYLALKMTPINPALREHVEQVRVLLDTASGLIVRLEMRDVDGDRTLIAFSNAKTSVGLKDSQLQIAAPADVKVTRPLAGLEGPQEPQEPQK